MSVPVLVVVDVGFALLTHQAGNLVAITGGSLGALGASSAVGCVLGATVQTPQPPPGSSPFARRSSGGLEAAATSFVGTLAAALLCAPYAVLGWHLWGRPVASLLVLVLALAVSPLLMALGCVWGGRILDRRWPEVLQRVTWEK